MRPTRPPEYDKTIRDIRFSAEYNPRPERRGGSGGMYQNAGTETWIRNRDRLKSMWDARDAVTFDWMGGVLARVVLYVVGKLHCTSNLGDDQINAAYDEYFHGWCGDERNDDGTTRCDITGRHRFLKMVQMAFCSFLVDGDYGFVEIEPQFSPTAQLDGMGNPIPGTGEFCLQGIEADRIGSPLEATTFEDYIGGVKIDVDTGRVLYYRVFQRTRTNQWINKREIAPADFIHVFDPDRSDEYRGRTKLLRCLNDLRDIREWIEAEKIAGKTQAQWAALIGVKDPFDGKGAEAWTGKTDKGTLTQDAVWGKILKMAEGENFSMLSPSARPSGAFMSFIQTIIRKMSISLGLSYGLLWDLASLGGATARIEVQSDLRKIQYWQDNVIKSIILDRVRNKVVAQGVAQGVLPAVPGWKKCSFNFGAHITADLGYEMEADIQGLQHGILEFEKVCAKHGTTAREVFERNAQTANTAIQVGSENALPVEAFAGGQYPQITNQKASYLAETPQPPPPPASIEAIGDKGVGKLVEILEKIGEGTIDREHGIETLIRVFGLTRSQAEKLAPDEPEEADLNRAAGLDVKGNHPKPQPENSSSSNGSNGKKKPSRN